MLERCAWACVYISDKGETKETLCVQILPHEIFLYGGQQYTRIIFVIIVLTKEYKLVGFLLF